MARRTFRSSPRSHSTRSRCRLHLEALEDRSLPSVISGYVFQDANNNGLFDPGETPIAGNTVQLRNAANVVVASAATNSQGYYEFAADSTIDTTPTTLTQRLTFPEGKTNSTQSLSTPQFNPGIGQLQSVEIRIQGYITSEIKVENFDPTPNRIEATVSGQLRITGPHVDAIVMTASDTQTYAAGAFDGLADFGGSGGISFPPKTVTGQKTVHVTDPIQLAAFVGGGSLRFTETAQSTSSASGGGNFAALISSRGGAEIAVIYHYVPSNALAAGNYTIVQTIQPSGLLDGKDARGGVVLAGSVGTDSIPVVLGNTDLTNNTFGELRPSSIAGSVYNDADNDGVKEPGETGIAGVAVQLQGTDDLGAAVSRIISTGSNGAYLFANLRPGTYSISETQPPGLLDGKETLGNAGGSVLDDVFSNIVIAPGTTATGYHFGELSPSSLAGFVFRDDNHNGVMDPGEPGLAGVLIELTGTDDRGNPVERSQLTDAAGRYAFNHLRPGEYIVTELSAPPPVAPGTVGVTGSSLTGLLNGRVVVGSLGGKANADQISGIVLPPGSDGEDYNFAEIPPARLAGSVYHDANNNGVRDPGEAGIAGTVVSLLGIDDRGANVALETLTGPDGAYEFLNLRPGTYEVAAKQPAGYLDGKDKSGTGGGTAGNDLIADILLNVGQGVEGYDFGELKPANIAGRVGIDANNNGRWEPAEAGIGGVQITLTGTDDRGQAVHRTARTNAAGEFNFADLRPGTYAIDEAQPPAFLDGKDATGPMGGVVANDRIAGIVLASGQSALDYYFGELQPGSLSGFVFVDSNDNGQRDRGEAGIAGVVIMLTGTDDLGGQVARSAVTGPDGSYLFAGLRPGVYTLSELQPEGYDDGLDRVGTLGGTLENDRIANIQLGPGQQGANYNFGEKARVPVKPADVPITLSKFYFLASTARRR